MPRSARVAPGDWIFHVLNRANGGETLFDTTACYAAFLGLVDESAQAVDMRILAYCLMPNHWHMLLWPRADGDLSRFVHRISMRHTQRWHSYRRTTGRGHLYQGRYKSFAVRDDRHLLTVCRYIERNPLRANLVARAEAWPWSSAPDHLRCESPTRSAPGRTTRSARVQLTPPPLELPLHWGDLLNEAPQETETEAIRSCVRRGHPFGDPGWRRVAAERLGLPLEARERGRPRKRS